MQNKIPAILYMSWDNWEVCLALIYQTYLNVTLTLPTSE